MSGGGAAEGGVGGGAAEVQYVTAKTSVWWDIENCQVPRVCDPHLIAQNISSALAKMDYKGPVTISAYGDTSKIPNSVQHALNSTGISLNHVPAGVKDASDKKILVDMLFWAVDNPPPSNYLLISGDRDFSNALHQLRMRRYNILLAQPLNVSQALFAAAKSVWLWTSLLAGGPPLSDSSNSIPDPQQTSQPSDSSGNQKGGVPGGNGKADSRSKTKQVRKNPSQTNTNLPRTPSKEFGQPVSESQESLTSGTSNSSDQKWRQNIQQPSTYMPMEPSSEAQEVAGMNDSFSSSSFPQSSPQKPSTGSSYSYQPEAKQLKEAPHKFFGGNFPNASGPNYVPTRPDFPMNQGKNKSHDHQAQYIQPLRPSDLLPQPNLQHGNKFSSHSSYPPPNKPSGSPFTSLPTRPDGTPSFTPNHPMPSGPPFTSQPSRPYGPAFTPPPPANLPDISGLNISGYPNGVHYNPSSFQQSPQHPGVPHHTPHFYHDNFHRPPPDPSMDRNMPNNGFWGTPGCPAPPFAVQGLIGNILRALHTLKTDKMAPTEANIVDCIRYGEMNIQNFDVKMALDYAIEHQVVVMHKLGGNLPFYVGKKDPLWKCVNIIDSNEKKHSKKIWDAILKFLSSNGGRSAVQASQCKYHAATILKQSCLKYLALGDVLQILHVIIHVKKWIITHSSGWQPLSFLLPATIAADTKADVGTSTNPRSHSPKTSM